MRSKGARTGGRTRESTPGIPEGDETQARSLCLSNRLDLNSGLRGLGGAVVTPVPGLVSDPGPGILGIREDEAEASGVLEKPLIFRKGLEFGGVFLAVDALRVDKIDRQMFRVPVLAVTGQRDPFRGLADGIIMIGEIIDKKIKLMGA